MEEQKKRKLKREKIKASKATEFFGDCSELNGASWRGLFPGVSNEQIVEVLFKSSHTDILDKMIFEGCKNKRLLLDDIEVKSSGVFSSSEENLTLIDKQLESNDIVGISYYASILLDPYSKTSGAHGSTIVARKFNSKTNS